MSDAGPSYIKVDGVFVPNMFQPQNVRDTMDYKPRDDDVIIATYPKCGTTWMQYIVNLIVRRGAPFTNSQDFFNRTPFFEMCGKEAVINMPKPGALKIHMPKQFLKHWSDTAKYIVVVRNPKDCCVSLFHHTRMFPGYLFQDGSFDTFFELFMKGDVEFNNYFDHLIGWYEVKNKPNVLYVTFESLKADKEAAIMKIASFLGQEYVDDIRNNPQVLKDILHYSSFDHMQVQTNEFWSGFMNPSKSDELPKCVAEVAQGQIQVEEAPKKKATFVRKGVVGDYKNLMSDEQIKRLNAKFQEKCEDSELLNLWKGI